MMKCALFVLALIAFVGVHAADDVEDDSDELKWIGARRALLFRHSDMGRLAALSRAEDIEDDFYEITRRDVIRRHQELGAIVKAYEDAPLETEKLRKQRLAREEKEFMEAYDHGVIRIYFGADDLVLQGAFTRNETVRDLMEFVREFLANRTAPFTLKAPPREILEPQQNLRAAGLIPSAIVRYQGPAGKALREDLLDMVTSSEAIVEATNRLRKVLNPPPSTSAPRLVFANTARPRLVRTRRPLPEWMRRFQEKGI